MTTTTLTQMLVVHKEILKLNKNDVSYLLLRERGRKGGVYKYIPAVKFLKYNKNLIRKIVKLEIGDIINVVGDLTIVNARISIPELIPPYIKTPKVVVNIKGMEIVGHYEGLEDVKLERFIDIENDGFIKELSESDRRYLEEILDKKLEVE